MPLRALIIIFSKQYQDNILIQIYHIYIYTQIVTEGEMFQNKSILYWSLTENGGHLSVLFGYIVNYFCFHVIIDSA